MEEIKIGTIAFLKTSEEPVFVLDIQNATEFQSFPNLLNRRVTVRRPTQGRDGISHRLEFYNIEELETIETQHARKIAEMEEMKARFTSNASDIPLQGNLFSTN